MYCDSVKFCCSFQLFSFCQCISCQLTEEHDNDSGLVIRQCASAALLFPLLAQFFRLTCHGDSTHCSKLFLTTHFICKLSLHRKCFSLLYIFWRLALFSSCTGLRQAFQLSSAIFTHPQSLFAYTCKWQNHAALLPCSCRGWLTACPLAARLITIQMRLGTYPTQLNPSSSQKTQIQRSTHREVMFESERGNVDV